MTRSGDSGELSILYGGRKLCFGSLYFGANNKLARFFARAVIANLWANIWTRARRIIIGGRGLYTVLYRKRYVLF
jgi:hypothetical protein